MNPSPYLQRTCQLFVLALAFMWVCHAEGVPWYSTLAITMLLYWVGKGVAIFFSGIFK